MTIARTLAAACLALAALAARAELRAQVVATDPPSPAVLARDQPFHVRIAYAGAEGHALWARPYFRGERVKRTKTNASLRHEGDGAALGWFSLDAADAVDEVRVFAGGGKPYREFEAARLAVDVRGTGQAGAAAARPDWVESLRREEEARHREAREEERNQPASATDWLIGPVFMLAVLAIGGGAIAAPVAAWRRWRGPWRVVAAAPLVAMAFVAGRIVVDTARDPTSHNLWPFEILIAGGAGLALLAVAFVLKKALGAR